MSAGAGMEVGQQEAAFASNAMSQTAQGMIDLLKEAAREKKRSVILETNREKSPEGSAEKKEMDGFALAKLYEQTESKKLFLEKLLQLDEVKKNPKAVDCIRLILNRIHRYAHYYRVARAKGILAELIHREKNGPAPIPERWEDTPEFASEMKTLWEIMGVDMEAHLAPENRTAYDELAEALKEKGFSPDDLSHLTLQENEFVLSREIAEEGEPVSRVTTRYAVLSPERYEQYLTFVKEREEERKAQIARENAEAEKTDPPQPVMVAAVLEEPLLVLKEIKETGDIIVDANHRELQAFLQHEREQRQKEKPQEAPTKEERSEWLEAFLNRTKEAIREDQEKKREEEKAQTRAPERPVGIPMPAIPDPAILNLGPGIGR